MSMGMRRILRWLGILIGILVILIVALFIYVQLTWDRPVVSEAAQMTAPTDPETVARGEFLYNYSLNCWACHGSEGSKSPDEPQAGGLEFDLTEIGPPGGFGYLYGSNVTPDPETGIGAWSDGEVVRALREGLDREGHLIFPIMEAEWWSGLSDQDALAIVAYMRSLTPIRNEVPDSRSSFIAKALTALRIFKPIPPITSPVMSPPKGATVEYGEYLSYHASTCVGCHMPRNPNNAEFDTTRPFAGGLFPFPEEGFITTGSNLTPDSATGIGGWTEQQFVTAMRTGMRPDGTVMLSFMPWPSYSKWSDDDLRAVWLFLRSLEPIEHKVPPSTLAGAATTGTGVSRGEALYNIYCVVCHGKQGSAGLFTSIALGEVSTGMDDTTLKKFIAEGLPGTAMPGFGMTFSEDQIADIVLFLRSW